MYSKTYFTFILLLGFFLFTDTHIQAQSTLHLIVVAVTDDASLGEGCKSNQKRIDRKVKEIIDATDMELKPYYLTGSEANAHDIERTIRNLNCEQDDVIVFHYSGHGLNNGRNRWPRFLVRGAGDNMRLDRIHQKLQQKGARFLLTLGDCCNLGTRTSAFSGDDQYATDIAQRTGMSAAQKAYYKDLFLKAKGSIIASGSQRGQSSYYSSVLGGYFTLAFFEALRLQPNQCQDALACSWKTVMENNRKITLQVAQDYQHHQEPQYEISYESMVSNPTAAEPANIQVLDFDINKPFVYKVKWGNTLDKIARRFGVSVQNLKEWNDLRSNRIQSGQTLVINRNF